MGLQVYVPGNGSSFKFNDTCHQAIESLGIRAEPLIARSEVREVIHNETAVALWVADLAAVVKQHSLYGVSMDWEKGSIDVSSVGAFQRFLAAIKAAINPLGARLTLYGVTFVSSAALPCLIECFVCFKGLLTRIPIHTRVDLVPTFFTLQKLVLPVTDAVMAGAAAGTPTGQGFTWSGRTTST